MPILTTEGLAYLTDGMPGIGGVLKQRPEDFIVEEMPAVEPTGRGEFLHLFVEKKNRLTTDTVRLFSQHFKVPWEAIGYAGLKDKRAVTRQWFSVQGGTEERAMEFADSAMGIIDMVRHDRPLKRGDLRGNRFQIRIRGVNLPAVLRAKKILEHLARHGAPNFVGAQRFGYRNDNHIQGMNLIRGDFRAFLDRMLGMPDLPGAHEPERNLEARRAYERGDYAAALELWPTVHRFERQALGPLSRNAPIEDVLNGIDYPHRQLLISAFQSAIFNGLLNQRLLAGQIATLLPGDIALDHATGATHIITDPAADQPRADRLEISPTGPMWGPTIKRAAGPIADAELAALHETGITENNFGDGLYTPDGSRRPFRMLVNYPDVRGGSDEHGPYVFLSFELPRGSFATIITREIMKQGPSN